AGVAAAKERGRLDSAPQVLLAVARLQRPDVGERPAIFFRKGRRRLRLLELLAQIGRVQDLHAEKHVAARCKKTGCPARVDERGIDGDSRAKRATQGEAAP